MGLLDSDQQRNATAILGEVHRRHLPQGAAVIAVMTSLVETSLRNLASANVPSSQDLPHDFYPGAADGLGHDHASMGCFQQQTGTKWTPAGFGDDMDQTTINSLDGWGPPSVLMDVDQSAGLFLNCLPDGWRSMDSGTVCQQIQHSAFPDRYSEQHDTAVQIVHSLWPTVAKPLQAVSAAPVVTIKEQGDGFAILIWPTMPHPTEYRVFRGGQRVQTVAIPTAKVIHNGRFTVAGANSKGMGPISKPVEVTGL